MTAQTRAEASAAGLKRYFTGAPCVRGHIAERSTKSGKCIECRPPSSLKWREYNARWKAKYPGREQEVKYRHRYGVELSEIGQPPPTCEVCDSPHAKIVMDHCHNSDAFRGWLCDPCNTILGLAKDNPETLEKLAEYLRKPSTGVLIDRAKAIASKSLRTAR